MKTSLVLSIAVLGSVLVVQRFSAQSIPSPSVASISGTIADKGRFTLTGSGFGTGSAPLKFDDFEAGTAGSRPAGNGWDLLEHAPPTFLSPTYSDAVVRANSKRSMRANFTGGAWNSSFGVSGKDLKRVYVDAWYYYDAANPPSRNHKMIRFHANRTGEPNMAYTMFCQEGSSIIQSDGVSLEKDESYTYVGVGPEEYRDKWSHIQVYVEQSSPGAADGTLLLWVNGKLQVEYRNTWRTRDAGQPMWDSVWLGNYVGHGSSDGCGSSGDAYTYWDQVYISTSQARVEIGDAPTYEGSRHREIQVPVEWSDGRVSVTLQQGAFPDLNGKYLYVTNADGETSQGRALSASGSPAPSATPTAPNPPTNLRVVG